MIVNEWNNYKSISIHRRLDTGIPARYSPLLCGQCNITSGRGVSASSHVTRVADKHFEIETDIKIAILKLLKRHAWLL